MLSTTCERWWLARSENPGHFLDIELTVCAFVHACNGMGNVPSVICVLHYCCASRFVQGRQPYRGVSVTQPLGLWFDTERPVPYILMHQHFVGGSAPKPLSWAAVPMTPKHGGSGSSGNICCFVDSAPADLEAHGPACDYLVLYHEHSEVSTTAGMPLTTMPGKSWLRPAVNPEGANNMHAGGACMVNPTCPCARSACACLLAWCVPLGRCSCI